MNEKQFKLVAVIEAGIIVILLTALLLMISLNLSSHSTNQLNIHNDPDRMENEVRVIERELFINNYTGSETFTVDEDWDAIGIYVEGISSSDVSWNVTYPGFPEGALTFNGRSIPFAERSLFHIDGTSSEGGTVTISTEPMGNWTLNYNVEGGLVKFSIIKIKM